MTWLALQGFGGVLAVVQRVLVDEKRWLTNEEFIEDWAVAQVLPGPNVVNLALMIGDRYFGLRGGLAALAGVLAFPLLVVLVIAALFASVADLPMAQGALKGMGAVSAGLIAAVEGKCHVSRRMYCLSSYDIYSNCDTQNTTGVGFAWLRDAGYCLGVPADWCH